MISDGPEVIALGTCYTCGNPFSFNVDTVPSVHVDKVTRAVLEEGSDTHNSIKLPVCPACVKVINAKREAKGLPIRWLRTT